MSDTERVISLLKEGLCGFKVTLEKAAAFLSDVTFKGDVKFENNISQNGHAISGNEAGTVKIEKGDDEVGISFAKDFSKEPVVIASPIGQALSYAIKETSEKGFKIKLEKEAEEEIKFNWIAQVGTEGFSASDTTNENSNSESSSENTNSSLPEETASQENQNDNVSQNDNLNFTPPAP